MAYQVWEKMDEEKRKSILQQADIYLNKLDSL